MANRDLHLYIHYPFCTKKCSYCDFTSSEFNAAASEVYLKSLVKEIEISVSSLHAKNYKVSSVYFGGGNPGLIQIDVLSGILNIISKNFSISINPEITIELNPNHLNIDVMTAYKESGINRISLGVQSFSDKLLKILGRNHTVNDVNKTLAVIENTDFANFSIDMVFGIPTQTTEDFLNDLNNVVKYDIKHVSLYLLEMAESVPLNKFVKNGSFSLPGEDTITEMYLSADNILSGKGFDRYEISSFAKPGYESIHTRAYWNFEPYKGVGIGAHSFFNNQRYWNTKDLNKYTELINKGMLPVEGEEYVTGNILFNEKIFLSLRQKSGLNLKKLKNEFSENMFNEFSEKLNELRELPESADLFKIENNILRLKNKGILISDEISSQLIL